jgi:anti-sigma B factor antagonist
MLSVGGGFPERRHPSPEVHVRYRPIDESLLNRVRSTLATTQREHGRFPREAPLIVHVVGEVDIATAPRLRADIDAAFASGARELRIDLSATTFIDSSALHVLVDAARRAREVDRDLTIACPPGNIRRVIDIAGVAELLPLTDEAMA